MIAGIPKERIRQEMRVGATPKTVQRLIRQGFDVIIEKDAGLKATITNKDYEIAGAKIVESSQEVYDTADVIIKVQAVTDEEVEMLREGQITFSYLSPAQNKELLEKLSAKKVNAIAMDAIPRISRAQKMDVLSSMSNIAGYRAVIEAANLFGRFLNGKITAAGKVEPAKVLVIGAGVAGLSAIGTAKSLGAVVRAFDTRLEVAEQIESMGATFLTVEIEEDGSTDSGYSKLMSPEFIKAEMALFKEQAKEVDIIITTALIPGREAPKLILDYHVEAMSPGSVIIDLAAENGGNCVLTRKNEVYQTDNGVHIVGKIDQMPGQASQLYGNNICHLIDDMGRGEDFKIDMEDDIVSRAMVTYNGEINWPPEPLPVSPQNFKKKSVEAPAETKEIEKKKQNPYSSIIVLAIIGGLLFFMARFAPADFMQHFTVFVLSVFVGWQVIWNVSHALHTPLMAVTNAISGIIIIGGLLQTTNSFSDPITILAFIAIFVASINIVGGFLVTHRMLNMFRK